MKKITVITMALMLSVGTIVVSPVKNTYAQDGINVLSDSAYNEMLSNNGYDQEYANPNDYDKQYNQTIEESSESEQVAQSFDTEIVGEASEVNEKYAKILGKYDAITGYKDGMILFNNITDIKKLQKNYYYNEYDMSEESSFTLIDKNGTNTVITNKANDGTPRFDAIIGISTYELEHSVYTSQADYNIFKYITVKKGEKYALIDKKTNIVSLGGSQWYDDIISYRSYDGGIFYLLKSITGDNTAKYILVSENGDIVYQKDNCTSVTTFYDKGVGSHVSMYAFMQFKCDDNTETVIDFSGKVWYEGIASTDYTVVAYEPWVILQFENSYLYLNYNTGKVINGIGTVKNSSAIQEDIRIENDDKIELYDTDMNKLAAIQSDKKFNIDFLGDNHMCGGQGEYDTVIISTDDNNILYYNGSIKDWNEIESVGDTAFYTSGETEQNIKSKSYYGSNNAGIIMKYTLNDSKDYYVFISRKSGYTKAELMVGNYMDRSIDFYQRYAIYYMYEDADKNIKLGDGKEKNCKYRLTTIYQLKEGELVPYTYNDALLYMEDYKHDSYYYSEDGTKNSIRLSDGAVCTNDKDTYYKLKTENKVFGNTGYSCFSIIKTHGDSMHKELDKFVMCDNNGNEIQTIFDTSENIEYKYVTNYYENIGFVALGYSEKNGNRNKTVLYSYNGEEVVKGDKNNSDRNVAGIEYYYNKNANMGMILLPDKSYALLKNFGQKIKYEETIENIASDAGYKVNTVKGVDNLILTGIATETKISTIKEQLGNTNIQICDKDGNIADETTSVGTGSKVQLLNDGQVIETAVIVVKGDTDGTGTINILDMEAMQKSILGINKLTGVYKSAALLNDEEQNVSVLDMEVVQKDILGIKKIIQ